MVTKDRVGGVLAIAAAVLGLVLVFTHREADDDATPAAPPVSQVVPAPDGGGGPAPGGPLAPAPAAGQPAAPAPAPQGDGDDDDDG